MRYTVTTLLDALAVLLIAAGVGAATFQWISWWSIVVSGVIVLSASQLGAWASSRDDS